MSEILVNVATGKTFEPFRIIAREAAMAQYAARPRWYSERDFRKDGKVRVHSYGTSIGINLHAPSIHAYAFYDPEREQQAEPIRQRIASLEAELAAAKEQLIEVYKEPGPCCQYHAEQEATRE